MTDEPQETRQVDAHLLPKSLKPGDILKERYHLEGELGRGGMGVVFRAADRDLEREVAVKVVPEAHTSEEMRERLLREARAAAGLNHPHVISVYDVGDDQGTPFFVMELLPGETLANRRPQDMAGIIDIGKQVCSALDHAHAQNIVHRDLKPENLLYADESRIKLADLGLAFPTTRSRITQAGRIVGTAAYMAPEQAMGQAVDGRSDLYSLGVILYELSTGRLPFTGADPLAIVSQHIHAPVVPPRAVRSDVPAGLERVILRLLAKDPAKRFDTAGDVLRALDQALEGGGEESPEEDVASVALLEALSRGRLVGRDEELAQSRELWRRALAGSGHCLLLSGEPGAGKTRLGKELLVQAAMDGATVLTGACYEFEAATPYLPFVDAFRRWVHQVEDDERLRATLGDTAPQLAKFAPEIESRLGPFPPRPELPPQEERLLFFDAVVFAFQSLSKKRGLVFYIDDLHWADSGTLWLLGRLLRQVREESVLVVCSYRETELDRAHPLGKALVDWNRERLTTRIFVRRFGPEDTKAQLETLLGEAVSPKLAGAVHRETEGNPFFVEEVLKALIEDGQVRRKSCRWEMPPTLELTIPQSVMEAIGSRLDRVSPECNEVLRAAAVVGKTFRFEELLAASGGAEEDPLLDALDEAVAAQVLTAESDESFAFTHDKIREVLYKELNPIRRRRLHRRTAEGLDALKSRMNVKVEALAHHYIEAGDFNQGLKFAREAARAAEKVHAYEEAIAAYGKARDCAEALDLFQDQAELEEAMGWAHSVYGRPLVSAEHYENALRLTEDPHEQTRLKCLAASNYVVNGDPRGLALARAVREDSGAEAAPFIAAQALAVEGRYFHLEGKSARAAELLREAVTRVEGHDPASLTTLQKQVVAGAYSHLCGALQHLGQFDDSSEVARRCVAFGEAAGDPLAEAMGYEFLGENAISQEAWEEAMAFAQKEKAIAERINSRDRYAWTTLVDCIGHQGLGNLDQSLEAAREGVELAAKLGERRLEGLMRILMAQVVALRGDHDEGLALARAALEFVEPLGMVYHLGEAHRIFAAVHTVRGEYEQAVGHAEKVMEITAGLDSVVSRLWLGPTHVEALSAWGRKEEAREVLETYAALVGRCQAPLREAEVERLRAGLEG